MNGLRGGNCPPRPPHHPLYLVMDTSLGFIPYRHHKRSFNTHQMPSLFSFFFTNFIQGEDKLNYITDIKVIWWCCTSDCGQLVHSYKMYKLDGAQQVEQVRPLKKRIGGLVPRSSCPHVLGEDTENCSWWSGILLPSVWVSLLMDELEACAVQCYNMLKYCAKLNKGNLFLNLWYN